MRKSKWREGEEEGKIKERERGKALAAQEGCYFRFRVRGHPHRRKNHHVHIPSFVSPISPSHLPYNSLAYISSLIHSLSMNHINPHQFQPAKNLTCPNIFTSPLTLVPPAPGTQTLRPSQSIGDTRMKMSQACTRVMSNPWHPKTCTRFQK